MKGNKLIDDRTQISVNLLKYKSHGKNFEIAVNPDLAVSFKEGDEIEIEELVNAQEIFEDMKKGLFAKTQDLNTVFQTTDFNEIVHIMLEKGELQFTQKYREDLRDRKRKKVINLIHINAVNPKTGLPHPTARIESAMAEAKVKIDNLKRAQDQMNDIVNKLRPILPISVEKIKLELDIPAVSAAKLYGKLAGYGQIIKENWLNDGSLSVVLEIPAGLREQVVREIGHIKE